MPTSAITWLVAQQCPNGGFQAYRADPNAPCDAPNPASYSGPDSNSTALAAMALRSVGRTKQATRATAYLRTLQNSDGGFAYYKGGSSDVNSTGLALSALRPQAGSTAVAKRITRATRYLRAAQLRCTATQDRGLLPYQPGGPANSLASAQAAVGLTTTLPAKARRTSAEALTCRNGRQVGSVSTRNALLAGAASALRAGNGTAPSSFGDGPDLSATAQMTIALAAAKQSPSTVRTAVRALKRNAAEYTSVTSTPSPAALGTLLQVAAITPNSSPTSFGAVNLTRRCAPPSAADTARSVGPGREPHTLRAHRGAQHASSPEQTRSMTDERPGQRRHSWAEPYKIKMVEPLRMTSPELSGRGDGRGRLEHLRPARPTSTSTCSPTRARRRCRTAVVRAHDGRRGVRRQRELLPLREGRAGRVRLPLHGAHPPGPGS